MTDAYVHGYDPRENVRLQDQASTLVDLLHGDTCYPAGSRVLEAGCGVGAQTVTLAKNSPGALITSIDISETSVAEARRKVEAAGFRNVEFQQADIFNLPFEPESFDHVFVCFVLEHLPRPVDALRILKTHLKPGGTITVIEGDHGSTYFHPEVRRPRGDRCRSNSRRRRQRHRPPVNPLLESGFHRPRVSPHGLRRRQPPRLVDGFTKTFTAMVEGVRDQPSPPTSSPPKPSMGHQDLHRTTAPAASSLHLLQGLCRQMIHCRKG